jgi:hypothetical protein
MHQQLASCETGKPVTCYLAISAASEQACTYWQAQRWPQTPAITWQQRYGNEARWLGASIYPSIKVEYRMASLALCQCIDVPKVQHPSTFGAPDVARMALHVKQHRTQCVHVAPAKAPHHASRLTTNRRCCPPTAYRGAELRTETKFARKRASHKH